MAQTKDKPQEQPAPPPAVVESSAPAVAAPEEQKVAGEKPRHIEVLENMTGPGMQYAAGGVYPASEYLLGLLEQKDKRVAAFAGDASIRGTHCDAPTGAG